MHASDFSRYVSPRKAIADIGAWLLHLPFSPPPWQYGLAAASFGTTAYGAHLLYGNESGWMSVVLPVTVAGLLHAIILAMLRYARARASAAWFAGTLLVQAVPAGVSTFAHWKPLNARSVAIEYAISEQTATVRAAGRHAIAVEGATKRLAVVRDHSEAQSLVETARGNTCGSASAPGAGFRNALRADDQKTFQEKWEAADARAKKVRALQATAGAIEMSGGTSTLRDGVAKLAGIVNAMREIEADTDTRSLLKFLEKRQALGRGQIEIPNQFVRPGGPTHFTCPDAVLDRVIGEAIEALASIPPLPEVHFVDPTDPKVSLDLALSRILNAAAHLAGLDVPAAPLTSGDKAAVGLAVLVELVLWLSFVLVPAGDLSSVTARARNGDGKGPGRLIGFRPVVIDTFEHGTSDIVRIRDAALASTGVFAGFAAWLTWSDEGAGIALPIAQIETPEIEAAFLFCEYLVASGLASRAPMAILRRSWWPRRVVRPLRKYVISNDQLMQLVSYTVAAGQQFRSPRMAAAE